MSVTTPDAARLLELERELERLRRTNAVLMDRVEHRIGQEGNAFAAFQAAINLEKTVAESTAELRELNLRLERELALRRKFESALLRAKQQAEEATRGKTRFLAAASHDLRQPLNAATLYLESVAAEALAGRDAEAVRGAQHALATLGTLLSTLLDISRLDTGVIQPQPEAVALEPLLRRLARECAALGGRALPRVRVVPRGARVHTDAALLETVLRNLLGNAVKYAPDGGILLAARRQGARVRIRVGDRGPGIAAADLPHVFDEFWRAPGAPQDPGSLGLGLSIVERVCSLLGTRIEVHSAPGRGASFLFDLPLVDAPPAVEAESVERVAVRVGFPGCVVALVDDNRQALLGMQRLLESWECEVAAATSVEEVLTALIDADRSPRLIIVDYHLDAGRTGSEALAAIRNEFSAAIPALVVSSDTGPALRETLRAAGLPLLTKPVDVARLRALMQHLLRPQR